MIKQSTHSIKGMQRDLTVSKFNSEFAFDAQNIRITARDNNTLLSITNEKGNKEITLKDSNGSTVTFQGTVIGYNVLNNYLTLFTTDNTIDRIYRLERKDSYFECTPLYTGSLDFNTSYPIESVGVYENEDIQKVYWIDGKNQARVINITAPESVKSGWTDGSFDFVLGLNLEETVTIERNSNTASAFAPGVIQYAFTYYNMYGQESNIFYTSPLQYISFDSRGANPEEKVSNSFTITIKNPDPKFDYLRIYSIHRTSIDATPTVLNVVDIAINGTEPLMYTDNGTTGTTIDPTELLYIGGENIVPQTMTHKDNTLFLGNILLKNKVVDEKIVEELKTGQHIYFSSKKITNSNTVMGGYYPYRNTMSYGAGIRRFKYLEWYRFGIQFQNKSGKWSEAVYIGDFYNSYKPEDDTQSTIASYNIPSTIISKAVEQGFVRARGVVVYPSYTDREVIAQGILCPTVYNIEDRYSNSPFAQASWFTRPNLSVDGKNYVLDTLGNYQWYNYYHKLDDNIYDIVNLGAWAEFRHNYPIPDNWKRNAEIQCLANVPDNPYVSTTSSNDIISWVASHKEYFFVDQSILTFHSPDIEFDDVLSNIDMTNVKLRIVGAINYTANASDIDIQTSTPQIDTDRPGFYKEPIGTENIHMCGVKSLIAGMHYIDTAYKVVDVMPMQIFGFMVYPWHRNGSLNNQPTLDSEDSGTRTAMLSSNKRSNLKFAGYTHYLPSYNVWEAFVEDDDVHTGISGVVVFNSNEQSMIRIPAPDNSDIGSINYYGNIDKVVTPTRNDEEYNFKFDKGAGFDYEYEYEGEMTNLVLDSPLNKSKGYPIIAGIDYTLSISSYHAYFISTPAPLWNLTDYQLTHVVSDEKYAYGTDPVSIKYKSTPHAVLALNYTKDKKQNVLPTFYQPGYMGAGGFNVNYVGVDYDGQYLPWDTSCKGVHQDVISRSLLPGSDTYGFSWLAELYRDDIDENTRFGGKTQEALELNQWLPAGDPISLISGYNTETGKPIAKTNATIYYTEGDTFFQRYDCLKTYPYTMEDQNSVVEIVSFMCETRVNIDGRYDKNRGQTSNLVMTPENFNLINPVYTQKNNFFNYRTLNYNKYSLDYFPNTVTWTKEKQAGAIVDTWTNITMASTLDLDGDKGEVVSLNTFNNEIFCFQKQGFSNILFNSRVQIPTSDGMPIEISNGLKVNGKRYISNTIGCNNKWSIKETPSGLYFIDNITNSIYLFNGQIGSLSDKLGFRQWTSENNSLEKWDPVNFKNFVTYYDKNNGDVYFVNNETALVYSELLGQFTSFMSYGQVPAMFNINSNFYTIQYGKVWEQFAGEYNMFFGYYYPYSVTFVSNADEPYDKIFNTVEFRADCWTKDTLGKEVLASSHTFDTLEVWNEYQKGVSSLTNMAAKPSPLKKKFRVWRANIPRANKDWNGTKANKMDRIRNTWAYVKLSMNKENTDRMEFHDMIVHYFV